MAADKSLPERQHPATRTTIAEGEAHTEQLKLMLSWKSIFPKKKISHAVYMHPFRRMIS
jgi:hypothetical protein